MGSEQGNAEDCHKTALTQTAMNLCAIEDGHKADAKLEHVYNKLIAKVSPEGQEKLRAAKNSWTIYRVLQCEFNTFGSKDGSINPMVISLCYADMANDYTKVLRAQLDCVEGDASCGRQ